MRGGKPLPVTPAKMRPTSPVREKNKGRRPRGGGNRKENVMNAISQLREEHQAVITALAILAAMADRVQSSGHLHVVDTEKLLEFFRVFVDRCHHRKEEGLLFPLLEEVGIGRTGGPIGVMLAEHSRGRDSVAALGMAVAAYGAGDLAAPEEFALQARLYEELLRRHIDKENGVLFVLAERHLDDAALARLEARMEELEREEIGAGRHQAMHRLLRDLACRYGVESDRLHCAGHHGAALCQHCG